MASRRVDAIDAYLKCRNGRRVSTVGRNHCNLPPYDCNPSLRTHSCFVTFDQSRSAWRRQKGFGGESVFTFWASLNARARLRVSRVRWA